MNLNEGIDNHLTVVVPGTQPLRFLCIAYGLAWSEVTASNLLLLDETGKVLEGSGAPDPTAFFIHSRIHKKHPHAVCVLHTHMPHATALCCLEDMELKMINQNCLRFYDEVAYDTDYKGLEGTEAGIETIYPDADPSGMKGSPLYKVVSGNEAEASNRLAPMINR